MVTLVAKHNPGQIVILVCEEQNNMRVKKRQLEQVSQRILI